VRLAEPGIVVFAVALWSQSRDCRARKDFYGPQLLWVLSVYEHHRDEPEAHHFLLQHGKITHGLQLTDPTMAQVPTSYYAEIERRGSWRPCLVTGGRRIGVVGLGTGTMAAYGR